jgi:hypothetical protein
MQLKSVKQLIGPLIRGGHAWQHITINGEEKRPLFLFSNTQWFLLLLSSLILLRLPKGISEEIIGYVMGAFSISVSLFMSLLISIFDKFENTKFEKEERTEDEIIRLKQKKNFFKRFISITSYLVILSIMVIILCSFTYLFNLSVRPVLPETLVFEFNKINWIFTFKNAALIIYRITLNYFLLNYLILTLFITGSAYDFYMSEMDRRRIE